MSTSSAEVRTREDGSSALVEEFVIVPDGSSSNSCDVELEGGGDALPSRPSLGGGSCHDDDDARKSLSSEEYVFVRSASAPRERVRVAWSDSINDDANRNITRGDGAAAPTGGARQHTPTRSRTPTYYSVRGRAAATMTPPPMRPGRKKLGRRKQIRRDNALLLGHNQFREELSIDDLAKLTAPMEPNHITLPPPDEVTRKTFSAGTLPDAPAPARPPPRGNKLTKKLKFYLQDLGSREPFRKFIFELEEYFILAFSSEVDPSLDDFPSLNAAAKSLPVLQPGRVEFAFSSGAHRILVHSLSALHGLKSFSKIKGDKKSKIVTVMFERTKADPCAVPELLPRVAEMLVN